MYRPKDIQHHIRREFGINIQYPQANCAKTVALEAINGTIKDAYNALFTYYEDLNQSNPDSTIVLECTPERDAGQRFQRMFVCYSASTIGLGTVVRFSVSMVLTSKRNTKVSFLLPLLSIPMARYFRWQAL